jgi:hypothetical protein
MHENAGDKKCNLSLRLELPDIEYGQLAIRGLRDDKTAGQALQIDSMSDAGS